MEKLLKEKEVAAILGITCVALQQQRCRGVRPGEMPMLPWVKLGARVRYRQRVVEEYIAALENHGEDQTPQTKTEEAD